MRRRRRDRHRPSLPPRSIPRRKEEKKKELLTGAAKGWGRERETPSCLGEGPSLGDYQLPPPPLLSREDWRERWTRREFSLLGHDTIPNSPHVKYSPAAHTHILIFPSTARKYGDQTPDMFSLHTFPFCGGGHRAIGRKRLTKILSFFSLAQALKLSAFRGKFFFPSSSHE